MSGAAYMYPGQRAEALVKQLEASLTSGAISTGSGPPTAPLPDAKALAGVLDVAFFGSLEKEETRSITATLAYAPRTTGPEIEPFSEPRPLEPSTLRKVGPAANSPRTFFLVDEDAGKLWIWGLFHLGSRRLDRQLKPVCPYLLVRVVREGVLVIELLGKRIALYSGGQETLYPPDALSDALVISPLLKQWWKDDPVAPEPRVLLAIAGEMAVKGIGGVVLVAAGANPEAIMTQTGIEFSPPSTVLREALHQATAEQQLDDAIAFVAQLSSIDGAVVLTKALEVLRFATKIEFEGLDVARVLRATPPSWTPEPITSADALGGTRHQSAAQWCTEQEQGIALVVSQDGAVSFMASQPDDRVVVVRPVQTFHPDYVLA